MSHGLAVDALFAEDLPLGGDFRQGRPVHCDGETVANDIASNYCTCCVEQRALLLCDSSPHGFIPYGTALFFRVLDNQLISAHQV